MSGRSKAMLWVRGGPEDDATIDLTEVMTSIGRAPYNDIVVDEAGVSRHHARIRKVPEGYWIEDLGSRNGTFVNKSPVEGEGMRLRDMDRIELGGTHTVHWVFRESEATVEIPRHSVK